MLFGLTKSRAPATADPGGQPTIAGSAPVDLAPNPIDATSNHAGATPAPHRRDDAQRWAPAADHAALLLAWMQGPDGRTGYISASELADAYAECALAHDLQPHRWQAVARELRKILQQPKRYTSGAQRVRIWFIPVATPTLATLDGEPVLRRALG